MGKLANEYRGKYGQTMVKVKDESPYYIFVDENDDRYYEVFRAVVRNTPERVTEFGTFKAINGEVLPGNESFGKTAYTANNWERANELLDKLKAKIKP